eukprot:12599325-Prorocentrum_lima.AAC.1
MDCKEAATSSSEMLDALFTIRFVSPKFEQTKDVRQHHQIGTLHAILQRWKVQEEDMRPIAG